MKSRAALSFTQDGDPALAAIKRLGLIVLKSDETLEPEFQTLFHGKPVIINHTRIESADEVTTATLSHMEADMVRAVQLLPNATRFDVIGYGCTSGATVIGEEKVAALIHQIYPNAAVTSPITAVKAQLKTLNARRVGVLTPYVPEVTEAILSALETAGFEISAIGSFNEAREEAVARISPSTTFDALRKVKEAGTCDALFVSCTNLRTLPILQKASEALGVPVISSNSALAWHMGKLAGIKPG